MNGQSTIFGEDPDLYDRFRPGYPRELMETVVAATSDLPVLEIGAGTGKATKALLALGKAVHALEPDARMAALLDFKCRGEALRIENVSLEDAMLVRESYDLVLAAQAWHWVDPEIAYDAAADSLVQGGVLALLWHHPDDDQGLLGAALEQLYAELAPSIDHFLPGSKGLDYEPTREPRSATARFGGWSRIEHRWKRTLDAPSLIGWLCSSSDHRLLPVEERLQLMSGVAAVMSELGDEVSVNMATVAHMAYRI